MAYLCIHGGCHRGRAGYIALSHVTWAGDTPSGITSPSLGLGGPNGFLCALHFKLMAAVKFSCRVICSPGDGSGQDFWGF